jgi:hypothetical protein
MKKVFGVLLLVLFVAGGSDVFAQTNKLSRSERKKVKKELRRYKKKPETYVKMINAKDSKITEQEAVIEELSNELATCNSKAKANSDSLLLLEQQYAVLLEKYKDATSGPELPSGTVYQVQVGYYKKLNLRAFNKRLKYVKAEKQNGGKRYVIGYFTDLNSAKSFNSDLRKLGVADAFVTQYLDGKRNMGFDANK